MGDTTTISLPNVHVFISYASEDDRIVLQLANTLKNAFGQQIHLAVDKRSILTGEKIADKLAAKLDEADILAVISTGIGRRSHDWGGWEVGYFERGHQNKAAEHGPLWGSMAFLCLKEDVPAPSQGRKYISLEIDEVTLEDSIEQFKRKIGKGPASSGIRDDDSMLGWFGSIGTALGHGDIEQNLDLKQKYKGHVADFKITIFEELKSRVKKELTPQKQLLFRYNLGDAKKPVKSLPDETKIAPKGGAMSVFGLPLNETTWKDFKEAIRDNPLGNFWCGALERMVLSAATAKELDVDSSHLIASNNPALLYRLFLTTGTTYYNNEIEVSVYLVDFFRRTDYGDPNTSLLLKALQLVTRYRFMFLEEQSEFHHVNIALTDIVQLPELVCRIIGELDLFTSDMYVADLQLPTKWGKFVPLPKVEEMYAVWGPLDRDLRQICAKVLAVNDGKPDPALSEPDAAAKNLKDLTDARAEFAGKVKEIREKTLGYNTELLKAMADKLSELATNAANTIASPT